MMKSVVKAACVLAVGAAIGAGAMHSVHRSMSGEPPRLPARPPMEAPPLVAEAEPIRESEPEPQAPPSKPPPPPGPEFFGFPVHGTESASAPAPEAAAPPPPAPAPAPPAAIRLSLMPGRCAVGFDADSTLHRFAGNTTAVTGFIQFDKGRLDSTARASIVADARTLDTGNPSRDEEMHADYLESQKFPELRFELTSVTVKTPGATSGPSTIRGTIEIHGVRREVEASCTGELRRDGCLHVKGEFPTKLTLFGITPPSMIISTVKDDINVWFELWARPERGTR